MARVAYQGVPGAFSHEACTRFLPDHLALAFQTFEEAAEAVVQGDCDRACLPVENSSAGAVPGVRSLVKRLRFRVETSHILPIRLHLLALPGVRLSQIRSARSHPVALAQCRARLSSLGLAEQAAFDTAGAAREVAEGGLRDVGAVASRTAAELYGLISLFEDLQDAPDNATEFVVVAR